MSQENTSSRCPKCDKECKDKRGLSVHLKKCENSKPLICSCCNENFSRSSSLAIHLTRCKAIKQQNLEKELASKEELNKLLYEKEVHNKHLQDKLNEVELKYKQALYEKDNIIQSKLEGEKNQAKKIEELKVECRLDLDRQLRIRDNDLILLNSENQSLVIKINAKEQENARLKEDLEELKVEKRELLSLYSKERQKDTNTTIINQNDNRVQLQCLDPSMIQGRINPPSYVIGDVPALVNMLRSLGVRNSYRINDKARGTLTWNKREEGEVRDPTGEKLMNHIIDSLNIDLIKERSYYEEEEKKLCDTEDPDLYLLQEARMFISFCNQLLKKDPAILKLFKKELIKQGKAKGDTEEDQVYETTYTKFITAIAISLFPNVYAWIELSFYELGRYIGSRIRNHYHIEGASRESLYIVIHNDNNYNKQVYSKKLIPFISEAVSHIIDDGSIESLLRSLVLGNSAINVSKAEKMIDYLKNPTVEDTVEVMRGIVSL